MKVLTVIADVEERVKAAATPSWWQRLLGFTTSVGPMLLLVGLWSCDGPTRPSPPPNPTPEPTATPSPTPAPPEPIQCRVRPVLATCCDDPATGQDEAYDVRGWTVPNASYLQKAQDLAGGCLSGVVIRTGPYTPGHTTYPVYDGLTPPNLSPLRDLVGIANSLGMQAVVDIGDFWAIKERDGDKPRNPLDLTCADTHGSPPPLYLEHARLVAEALSGTNWRAELGNEAFICRPSRQWEQGLIDAIHAVDPSIVIGSNTRNGLNTYATSHGDGFDFTPPLPNGGHWTESDQAPLDPSIVDLYVELWDTKSVTSTIWPGESTEAQVEAVLRALREAR